VAQARQILEAFGERLGVVAAETDRDDQGDSAPADAHKEGHRGRAVPRARRPVVDLDDDRACEPVTRGQALARSVVLTLSPTRPAVQVLPRISSSSKLPPPLFSKACSVSAAPRGQKMINELVAQHPSSNHALYTPSSNHPSSNHPNTHTFELSMERWSHLANQAANMDW
jgi:hypothetical protein